MRFMSLHLLIFCLTCNGCSLLGSHSNATPSELELMSKYIDIKSRESIQSEASKSGGKQSSNSPKPPPPSVNLYLQTSAFLNPDAMQLAAPVRVWIFELEKFEKFSHADHSALMKDPEKVLGQDLRRSRDLVIAPEELMNLRWYVQNPGYIGVLADFRKPPSKLIQQRQLIAFDAQSTLSWKVVFSGNTLITIANTAANKTALPIDNDMSAPAPRDTSAN